RTARKSAARSRKARAASAANSRSTSVCSSFPRAPVADNGLTRLAKSNLTVRLITAAVVVPLLLALLFSGPVWGFYILVVAASAVGASELFGMTHPGDRVAQALGVVLTVAVSLALY